MIKKNGVRKKIAMLKDKALLFLAGAVSSLAFAPKYFVWVLPITLSLLFFYLNKSQTKKQAFGRAFWFGAGLGSVSTSWIANALMVDNGAFVLGVPFVWLGMGCLFGVFWGIPAVISLYWPIGWRRLAAWSALFTLFEWIRSWIFTGFPWNLLGSVWEDTLPILQSASVWGVYGLSFLTLCGCSCFAFWPRKKFIVGSVAVFALLFAGGIWRLYDADNAEVWGVRIRLVQPNIPQTLKWKPEEAEASFEKLLRLSRQKNESVTHVIWPESAVPFYVNYNDAERIRLMSAVRQGGTLLTGGLRVVNAEEKSIANSLFVLDDMANIVAHYDKSHLVPFGEYVPLRGILPFDKVVPIGLDFFEGSGVRTIFVPKAPPVGALVCYEVIFSGKAVSKNKRPGWLVNVTNDGWYGVSDGPYQHLGMARMRVAEEGLPVVRAANTGVSAVIDGYGKITASLPLGEEGVIDAGLPRALMPTLYSRGGVRIPLAVAMLVLLFSFRKRK